MIHLIFRIAEPDFDVPAFDIAAFIEALPQRSKSLIEKLRDHQGPRRVRRSFQIKRDGSPPRRCAAPRVM